MAGTPGPRRSLNDADLYVGSDDSLIFKGSRVVNAPPGSLWLGAPDIHDKDPSRGFLFFDDFLQQASATASAYATYTDMNDGATGTNAFASAAGGVYDIVTAAVLDDYHGIRTPSQMWKFVAAKELWLEAAFTVTEAATNASSWLIGLMDTATTGGLQTGASGPLANYSGAVIFKAQGAMTPKLQTSNGATQHTGAALGTVVSGQQVRIGLYFDGAATTGNVFPFIDIGDGNGWVTGTSQTITLLGLNAMYLMATIKAGGANAETMALDYLKVYQVR